MTIKYLDSKRISALSSDALVAHLKFNDNVTDSANSNNGTVTGTTTYVAGKVGKAFSFNGSSYVTLANESNFDIDYNEPFSIAFWYKTDNTSNNHVYGKGNNSSPYSGIQIGIYSGKIQIDQGSAYPSSYFTKDQSTASTANVWHHAVMTLSGSGTNTGCKLYVDGSIVSMNTASPDNQSASILNNISPRIGYDGNSIYNTGLLDDVRIYSRELDQSEVTMIYNSGNGTEETKPTNVQDNSILVEKDTGRRYWSSGYFPSATVTRSDDFSSDGWTDNDSTYIGVSGGSMNWNCKRDGSNDASVYDLTSTSANWVLRFKLTVTNVSSSTQAGNGFYVGLSDSIQTAGQSTSQDFIGVSIYNDNTDTYRTIDADGSALPRIYQGDSNQSTTYNTGSVWYYEIIKTGSSYTVEAFSGSDYSTGSEGKITGSSDASGLRYLKVLNDMESISTSTNPFQGTINDLKFYNGVTSV